MMLSENVRKKRGEGGFGEVENYSGRYNEISDP